VLTLNETEGFLTGLVDHENVFDSPVSLVAVNIVKMMFLFCLNGLSALRTFPVFLLRYLTYIMTRRLHLNQQLAIMEVPIPLSIKWVGISLYFDMSKCMNIIIEPDEGFACGFILKSPCTAFGVTEVTFGNPYP